MTDQEIIEGLLARDNRVTETFFYDLCRPLLSAVMRVVYNRRVDYDEMVSELYAYLMADDGAKLRMFAYRSSLYQWIKVVATRFFIRNRDNVIENESKEPLYQQGEDPTEEHAEATADRVDINRLLEMMDNRRYAHVIRNLILLDADPAEYARSEGITVDNLYNLKRRAMAAFSRLATKYYSYGR